MQANDSQWERNHALKLNSNANRPSTQHLRRPLISIAKGQRTGAEQLLSPVLYTPFGGVADHHGQNESTRYQPLTDFHYSRLNSVTLQTS
jgi:hypothetical protein